MLTALRTLWFASRKIRLPVDSKALVLEIGSGDSPCPRSDVLFDIMMDPFERPGATVADRPLVLGQAEHLPFRDKAFDYAVAIQVFEHTPFPERMLAELQRVSKAGYIETPSFWFERVNPFSIHRLEVGVESFGGGERLVIRKKESPRPDPELNSQFHQKSRYLAGVSPEARVTRFYWQGTIPYRVVNPTADSSWPSPREALTLVESRSPLRRLLKSGANALRPRRPLDIVPLLRCPDCADGRIQGALREQWLRCASCERRFDAPAGVPRMHRVDWKSPVAPA